MGIRIRHATPVVAAFGLGLLWASMGLGGMVELAAPLQEAARRWADQFHPAIVLGASAAELAAGSLVLFGRVRSGLIAGILLLAAFSSALVTWPPTPDQTCGCGGVVGETLMPVDPLLRNAVIAAASLLLIVLCASGPPRRTSTAA